MTGSEGSTVSVVVPSGSLVTTTLCATHGSAATMSTSLVTSFPSKSGFSTCALPPLSPKPRRVGLRWTRASCLGPRTDESTSQPVGRTSLSAVQTAESERHGADPDQADDTEGDVRRQLQSRRAAHGFALQDLLVRFERAG